MVQCCSDGDGVLDCVGRGLRIAMGVVEWGVVGCVGSGWRIVMGVVEWGVVRCVESGLRVVMGVGCRVVDKEKGGHG